MFLNTNKLYFLTQGSEVSTSRIQLMKLVSNVRHLLYITVKEQKVWNKETGSQRQEANKRGKTKEKPRQVKEPIAQALEQSNKG